MSRGEIDVLIIEDDDFKRGEIESILNSVNVRSRTSSATSVQSAIAAVESSAFDCILLDIALPSHNLRRGEGAPASMPSGGIEVLMELSYLERRDPVVIVTQYPEVEIDGEFITLSRLERRLTQMMNANVKGVILFERHSDGWRDRLKIVL